MRLNPVAGSLSVLMAGVAAGIGAVLYVSLVDGNALLVTALPFVLALLLLLVLDKRLLFFLILLFRASGDVVFESSKFAGGIGVGGLINALVILIALLFVLERPSGLNRRIVSIWMPVLLVALAAAAHSPVMREAARTFLGLLSYAAVFVIAFYIVRSRADFEKCVNVILLSSLIPAAYAFVDIAQHGATEGFRLQSTFTHPNILAFYLVLNISLLFYRLKTAAADTPPGTSPAWRWPLVMYMLLLTGLLLLTQTRSAWAGCLAVFALYGLVFERRYLLYLAAAPLLALLIPSVRDRLLDLASGNEYVQYAKLNSFAWRQLLWKSGLQWMSGAQSVFGYGLDAFKHYSPVFFPLAGRVQWGAHSTFVQWYFEAGVVGVLSAAWMYLRLFFTLRLGAKADRLGTLIVITLLIEYLFFAFSDNMLDYLAFNWYYWFFIGAACALAMLRHAGQSAQARPVPDRHVSGSDPSNAASQACPGP